MQDEIMEVRYERNREDQAVHRADEDQRDWRIQDEPLRSLRASSAGKCGQRSHH